MKYVIDLPDDYDKNWIMADMPITIRRDGADYMRRKTLLEPYKPEQEPEPEKEVFEVGDEVINLDGGLAYVLIPNYENDNERMILLMQDYVMPQMARKITWEKTGKNNKSVKELIRLAYEALNEVDE